MFDFAAFGADPLLRFGGAAVTLGGVATGLVIFLVAWALSRLVGRSLARFRERAGRSAGALYVLEKMASYGLIVFGAFAALSAAGLNLSSLAVSPAPSASASDSACRGWSRSSSRACS